MNFKVKKHMKPSLKTRISLGGQLSKFKPGHAGRSGMDKRRWAGKALQLILGKFLDHFTEW